MHGLLHERGLSRLVETLGDLGINDVFVLDAFRRVPRHLFVDPAVSDSAYTDVTLPLGYQQTLSQLFMSIKQSTQQLFPCKHIKIIYPIYLYQLLIIYCW